MAVIALVFLGWWEGILLPKNLHVESDPPGAWAFADGKVLARTSAKNLKVPQRTGSILLESDGYHPFLHNLGPWDQAFRVKLSPLAVFLDLDSRPSKADVYVNGALIGKTPLRKVRLVNDLRGWLLLVKRKGFGSFATQFQDPAKLPAVIDLGPRRD